MGEAGDRMMEGDGARLCTQYIQSTGIVALLDLSRHLRRLR